MKFYAEIHHPTDSKVLWHYFIEGSDAESVREAVIKRVADEHGNGFLLDTGGAFILAIQNEETGALSGEKIQVV